jgi:opacity protein-like surface antigen
MKKSLLTASFLVAMTSASLAQVGNNPGSVILNVYEELYATYGYDFAFGYSPPPPGFVRRSSNHRGPIRERLGANSHVGNGTSASR